MLYSYYTLRLLADGLRTRLAGMEVTEAYSQERHILTIGFGPTLPALVVTCLPNAATLFLHPRYTRARRNSASVLSPLTGRTVLDVAAHPSDRVVLATLSGELRLAALCYGTTPNVLLLDGENRIVDAFLNARGLTGSIHVFPPEADERIPDPGAIDRALDASADISVADALGRAFPRLGRTLVRELLHRAGPAPGARTPSFTERDRLRQALVGIHRELAEPRPVIYTEQGTKRPLVFSLIPLRHLPEAVPLAVTDVHEAVRTFLSRRRSAQHHDAERAGVVAALTRALEKTRRAIAAVRDDLARTNRADDHERQGHLLMMHGHAVPRGERSVTLQDDAGPCVIALDPRRTAIQNAQRCFEKARSARTARLQATARLADLENQERHVAALRAEVEEAGAEEELRQLLVDRATDLAAFGIRPRSAAAPPPPPFRLFTVEGGFQVWAGKSSANNDLLTQHHARPNDLWFHARGGSGAHVVLKTGSARGEPGRKAKEQAAAVAAYYSKLRNAGLVPVAMTERKYVRKPKGAPPGTVTIDRETVLLVRPGLPAAQPDGERTR